ncbi:hypothetical protein COLO4_26827 [Corchorus olitorius]|uniref:Uncharacterized protein n=1 Tax=Corchorus olitorius TaxID=93759 RepID=A0A1R3HUF9_9ROSI|nr:hypothetical protein COLO4_26827 [Corchorus olitorius]
MDLPGQKADLEAPVEIGFQSLHGDHAALLRLMSTFRSMIEK